MPSKNSHSEPGTFVYKDEIYTTGGEGAGNKVWQYKPRTDEWSTFRTLPESLVAPIARIVDGQLIVAGGGAPTAAKATDSVRSMLVDNNPPVIPALIQQPVPGSDIPEGPTLISMEAEYFDVITETSTHQWVNSTQSDSSNDGAMTTTPDQGDLAISNEDTPMLGYMVYFNYPGKHYLWIRGAGDSDDAGLGTSDSLHVGMNGAVSSSAYRVDQFPTEWTWSRRTPSDPVATLNIVDAGVNIINFWMREDGLSIDKFIITSDPDFVPSGHGPELTDGSNNYVPPVPDNTVDEPTQFTAVVPVATENTNDSIITPVVDASVAMNTSEDVAESNNGFFSGSASNFALLTLFTLCLFRFGRFKALGKS